MNRLIVGVSTTLLLSAMLLYATPAQATANVDCSKLRLTKASGVPGSSTHNYTFGGTCHLDDPNPKKNVDDYYGTGAAVATARWDGNSHTFTEHIHLPGGADTHTVTHSSSFDLLNGGFSSSTNVGGKGPHVGTGAEDATFTCSADPVIHGSANCTLVSHYNATGWGDQNGGFAASAVNNHPLLQGIATLSQAKRLSRHNASIRCNDLHLVAAKGVPNGKKRSYRFQGTCELYHTQDGSGGLRVTRVLAKGTWDAEAQQAWEGFTVLTAPNEGGGGFNTTYACDEDPWLNPHAHCSMEAHGGNKLLVYDPVTDLRELHPITMGLVNKAQVAKLSGPKRGPSRVNRGGAMANAHGKLHLPPGPLHVNRGAATANMHAHAAHLPPPKVVVVRDSYYVDQSCHDKMRLIVVTVTVQNDGGPLPIHKWLMNVRTARGVLGSGGYYVPPLAPHAHTMVQIPVWVQNGMVAKLPGTHQMKLIGQGYGHMTTTKIWPPVTLPAGICQPKMRMRSPAAMHLKANRGFPPSPCVGAKCRQQTRHVQPKPIAPMHQMSLPTMQLR